MLYFTPEENTFFQRIVYCLPCFIPCLVIENWCQRCCKKDKNRSEILRE